MLACRHRCPALLALATWAGLVPLLRAADSAGAPVLPPAVVRPETASVKLDQRREHWAFRAPVRPPVPRVKNERWPRNPIDRFILARLEKEGLTPSAEADRATLLRRLSLDLVGLPPS